MPKVRFEAVSMKPPQHRLPPLLLGYSRADVANQRVTWRPSPFWAGVFAGRPALLDGLTNEVIEHGGIRRTFVHGLALGDPVDLFLATMAWGFGADEPWHKSQQALPLTPAAQAAAAANLGGIVKQTQLNGAGAGWTVGFKTNKVPGLGISFLTKFLYFAGYSVNSPGERPLILDQKVHAGLVHAQPGRFPATLGGINRKRYLDYLELAASWASDPSWNESPEVVEFALFKA